MSAYGRAWEDHRVRREQRIKRLRELLGSGNALGRRTVPEWQARIAELRANLSAAETVLADQLADDAALSQVPE